jgi:hypothetical protein
MHEDEVADLLGEYDARLAAIAAEAQRAREQVEQALSLLNAFREEIARHRRKIIMATETVEHVTPPKPRRK